VVDIAHDALIRHWSLLRQWLNENRDAIELSGRLKLLLKSGYARVSLKKWRTSYKDRN
jgi:hypothetical protein